MFFVSFASRRQLPLFGTTSLPCLRCLIALFDSIADVRHDAGPIFWFQIPLIVRDTGRRGGGTGGGSMPRHSQEDPADLTGVGMPDAVTRSRVRPGSDGGRGGDRRPLKRLHDRSIENGALLLGAMMTDETPGGEQFRHDHDVLFRRHARLIRALRTLRVPGGPFGGPRGVWDVQQYFDLMRFGRPCWHPTPRALTVDEMDDARGRHEGVQLLLAEGLAVRHETSGVHVEPYCSHCSVLVEALCDWAQQPFRAANPR